MYTGDAGDEDIDIETATQKYKEKGGVVIGDVTTKNKKKRKMEEEREEIDSGNASESEEGRK